MSSDLTGKVAVVTGAGRGIGRAIAERLAAAGARIVVTARDGDAASRVAGAVRDTGGWATAVPCDVTDPDSVDTMADSVRQEVGTPDVVVANAGIAGPTAALHEIDLAEWRACLAVDLDGVFLTFRVFLQDLLARNTGGSLIAISSVTGKRPLARRAPYAAAKMGVIGLVRTLAEEVGPAGIRVNAICPGAVDGPRIRSVFAAQAASDGISERDAEAGFVAPAALRRLVLDTEVADACVFLASDASAAITGEDLNVAAGLVMY